MHALPLLRPQVSGPALAYRHGGSRGCMAWRCRGSSATACRAAPAVLLPGLCSAQLRLWLCHATPLAWPALSAPAWQLRPPVLGLYATHTRPPRVPPKHHPMSHPGSLPAPLLPLQGLPAGPAPPVAARPQIQLPRGHLELCHPAARMGAPRVAAAWLPALSRQARSACSAGASSAHREAGQPVATSIGEKLWNRVI